MLFLLKDSHECTDCTQNTQNNGNLNISYIDFFCQLVLNRFLILAEVPFYSQHMHIHCKIIQEYVYKVNLQALYWKYCYSYVA